MSLINRYLQHRRTVQRLRGEVTRTVPRIICRDGFSVSVQASHSHYCGPRMDMARIYYSVECGFPSENVPEWAGYGESAGGESDVFGYVPVELVDKVIEKHGGLLNFNVEGEPMKRLFMLRKKRKGAAITDDKGEPLYFESKMEAKKVRDYIGGTTVVSLGPDHWRNNDE